MRTVLFALLFVAALITPAVGQDGPVSGRPVGEDSPSMREGSVGGMLSGPVSDASAGSVGGSASGGMLSGPLSDITVGTARSGRSMAMDPPSGASSSGAVRQPGHLPPLRLQRPVSTQELEALEERLRYVEPLPE